MKGQQLLSAVCSVEEMSSPVRNTRFPFISYPAGDRNRLQLMIDAHKSAEDTFSGLVANHADWRLVHLLFCQEALGKATVTKHATQICNRSSGTVRNMFRKFEIGGYAVCDQRVGRSELYRPTNKLREAIALWEQDFLQKN